MATLPRENLDLHVSHYQGEDFVLLFTVPGSADLIKPGDRLPILIGEEDLNRLLASATRAKLTATRRRNR